LESAASSSISGRPGKKYGLNVVVLFILFTLASSNGESFT
jgi:hypothetical protein